ncbi:hypothetical protein [Paracoccus sp. ME4]|uniref:hypothetical protein n=1 Tax=Paracoccus sp. ME4 TaxID=3138066 RepID=UPI00398AF8FA
MDQATCYLIRCRCGHEGRVGFSRWLHRDDVLRRTRCSVCGKKEGRNLRMLPTPGSSVAWAEDLQGVPVHQV